MASDRIPLSILSHPHAVSGRTPPLSPGSRADGRWPLIPARNCWHQPRARVCCRIELTGPWSPARITFR